MLRFGSPEDLFAKRRKDYARWALGQRLENDYTTMRLKLGVVAAAALLLSLLEKLAHDFNL